MTKYTIKELLTKANECKTNVSKEYKCGISYKWSYYFAKALISHKDVTKITIENAPNPSKTHISRQMSKDTYLSLARKFVEFVETKHRLPNYLAWKDYKISQRLYTYTFARCLVYYQKHGAYDSEITINEKVFTKPTETKNEVYNYFVKVFGKFDNTIDGALSKVEDRGYSYYYDDVYSNKQSIDRMKARKGINCTDSCHVFFNIMLQLIELKKYKKVECLHVQCQSGGHVKLRITMNDGTKIIRDPACVLSDNGKGIRCKWCTDNGTVNPSWFMENLYR